MIKKCVGGWVGGGGGERELPHCPPVPESLASRVLKCGVLKC